MYVLLLMVISPFTVVHILFGTEEKMKLKLDSIIIDFITSVSLKEKLSLEDLLVMINRIRKRIEFRTQNGYHDAPATSLVCYMMPDETLTDEVLMDEHITESFEM